MSKRISVIGAAVVDILAGGVGKDIFTKGSVPAKRIQMSFGGDALNEAVVLSGLGMKTELISLVGKDEAGEKILDCLGKNKVSTRKISISDEISTAMNIVRNNRESRTGAGKI
ncbi:MAG: carbohydrate kinase family protein [Butyrivibrio sp.]|nr:carbohydrate kinase family protein [Butyrivibrio sp.]